MATVLASVSEHQYRCLCAISSACELRVISRPFTGGKQKCNVEITDGSKCLVS